MAQGLWGKRRMPGGIAGVGTHADFLQLSGDRLEQMGPQGVGSREAACALLSLASAWPGLPCTAHAASLNAETLHPRFPECREFDVKRW